VRRADIVIVSKCPGELSPMEQTLWKKNLNIRPYQEIFFTTLRYRELLKVFENSGSDKHFYMTGNTGVLIVTGIANPEHITEYLSGLTTIIDLVIFPDHHYFKPADVILILSKFEVLTAKEKIIVTTEKDAVRIREMKELPDKLKKSLYYLPVNIRFLDNGEKKFDQFIKSYVGKNKRIG
jgi:tetraacyldisaccharide 4'-kinase